MLKKVLLASILVIMGITLLFYRVVMPEISKYAGNNPTLWEPDIAQLEAKTALLNNHHERVLFVGSSSIRFWQTLAIDMSPFSVIQHGFGGATVNDVVHFSDRLINAFNPRAVVVFVGTNDITPRQVRSTTEMLGAYRRLVSNIRHDLPTTPIIFIAITPSPHRWSVWPQASETNRLLNDFINSQNNLYLVDTSSGLLGGDGRPDKSFYRLDGLHLGDKGYAVWTKRVKAKLLQHIQP
jgi:lysophospholipase L1-like esterase